ncbi:methyl-coenzyme M reductase subunit D [Methanococcoides vulcani]|uniref:Methyl-coenzyme M reductase subunit D n=1 Tax=Methanococcoides vulcani TaxID=1353158 RepID=A0A1I0BEN1_9EURY|nr:methyl-coenzyme M reductase operon protein D [Methanococcoides vulcani]SET05004.1 methyl-coenzyme M reductase subunit D [Methanococcoides vulcani]
MVDSASNTENLIQIEIFPRRLLSPETAQELLVELSKIEGITRAFVQGPRLPVTVPYGPATGQDVNHKFSDTISIGETDINLAVIVGRIRLEVLNSEIRDNIREICERILPMGLEFREGLFLQNKQTVSDYAKRGPGADPTVLGLADPKGKVGNRICTLNPAE